MKKRKTQRVTLSMLPNELLEIVASNLPFQPLKQLSLVNKRLRKIAVSLPSPKIINNVGRADYGANRLRHQKLTCLFQELDVGSWSDVRLQEVTGFHATVSPYFLQGCVGRLRMTTTTTSTDP